MVKTSRIGLKNDLKYIIPAVIGIAFIVYLALLISVFLNRYHEDKNRDLMSRRDLLVAEYESYLPEFTPLTEQVLSLSIQYIPKDYTYSLAKFESENIIMLSLSQDILEKSSDAGSDTISIDNERMQNHEDYIKLVKSLKEYHIYASSEIKIRNCFDKINVSQGDSIVSKGITACQNEFNSFKSSYTTFPEEVTKYWGTYSQYWEIVKKIHSNPNKNDLGKLQSELKNTFEKLETSYPVYVKTLEYIYKESILGSTE